MCDSSRSLLELEAATRIYRRLADEPWLALLRAGATEHDYRRQLEVTYGFEAPLEAALAYTTTLRHLVDLRERSRAGLIAVDLMTLGLSPGQVANIPQHTIAPFADAIEAFGWLYVVERATLLHDSIRWQLESRFPGVDRACAYLASSHGVAWERWKAFGETLDRYVEPTVSMEDLEAAARDCFLALIRWQQRDRSYAISA